eukprot:scaffold137673_cov28-Prasinocladus_malaysianus.AAC.1
METEVHKHQPMSWCPHKNPGSAKARQDFRAFRAEGGVTIAALIAMAREDSRRRISAMEKVTAYMGCDVVAMVRRDARHASS